MGEEFNTDYDIGGGDISPDVGSEASGDTGSDFGGELASDDGTNLNGDIGESAYEGMDLDAGAAGVDDETGYDLNSDGGASVDDGVDVDAGAGMDDEIGYDYNADDGMVENTGDDSGIPDDGGNDILDDSSADTDTDFGDESAYEQTDGISDEPAYEPTEGISDEPAYVPTEGMSDETASGDNIDAEAEAGSEPQDTEPENSGMTDDILQDATAGSCDPLGDVCPVCNRSPCTCETDDMPIDDKHRENSYAAIEGYIDGKRDDLRNQGMSDDEIEPIIQQEREEARKDYDQGYWNEDRPSDYELARGHFANAGNKMATSANELMNDIIAGRRPPIETLRGAALATGGVVVSGAKDLGLGLKHGSAGLLRGVHNEQALPKPPFHLVNNEGNPVGFDGKPLELNDNNKKE